MLKRRQCRVCRGVGWGIVFFFSGQVEVQNKEGLVKEKAHCAPNGYFFVPVYEPVSPKLHIQKP